MVFNMALADIEKAIDFEKSVKKEDFVDSRRTSPQGYVNFIIPAYGGYSTGSGQDNYRVLPENLPAYNRYSFFQRRDAVLLSTPHYEVGFGNAVYAASSYMVTQGYELDSTKPTYRNKVKGVLDKASVGVFVGWPTFVSAQVKSFLTVGKSLVEIEREYAGYASRIKAIHHLNPLRCLFTDDPMTPVIYYDRRGSWHKLNAWDVMLFGDDLDATEGEYGLVRSAAERVYRTITVLAAVDRYLYEKVSGSRTTALHFIQGLTDTHLQDSLDNIDNEQARRGSWIYKGAAAIPIPGDIPLTIATIPLSEIPDGFDAEQIRTDGYIKYANAVGVAVDDIDPRIGRPTGVGGSQQTIQLNENAKRKGLAAWMKQWEWNVNNKLAPDAVTTFAFHEPTLDDQLKKADLAKRNADTNKVRIDSAVITADQARNVEVDSGTLPNEFLETDVTGGGTISDDEKPGEKKQVEGTSVAEETKPTAEEDRGKTAVTNEESTKSTSDKKLIKAQIKQAEELYRRLANGGK
jgi:hypothetical protein